MTVKPILFSGPMVRAILREIEAPGTGKTQTRRVIKPASISDSWPGTMWPLYVNGQRVGETSADPEVTRLPGDLGGTVSAPTPFMAGDLLWARETWRTAPVYDDLAPSDMSGEEPLHFDAEKAVETRGWKPPAKWGRGRPSIHMPRWASRLTLEVSGVKVERLRDISEEDARAEGVESDTDGWVDYLMPATQCCVSARDSYRTLWSHINGPGAWEANPWVAAISFRPHLCNIDTLLKERTP